MESEKFYDKTYEWILDYGPKILLGIVILLIGLWLIRILLRWFRSGMQERDVDPSLKPFLISLAGVALRVLLILGVMQIIGIQMTIFAAVIGAFGVAAGLALSGTLQNFASGVLILLLKPFRVGDNLVTQGMEGKVTSIQIFYTIITTFDNKSVIVPNSKLSNEIIVNLSREGTRRLDIELKFNYGVDHKQIGSILNKAIDDSEHFLDTPQRRIGISSLEPDGFKIMLNVWLNASGFQDNKLALQEKIVSYIKEAGILLPGMKTP